jgi:hypothetical protein
MRAPYQNYASDTETNFDAVFSGMNGEIATCHYAIAGH